MIEMSHADTSTKRKVKFITLGCKVNSYETQGMREELERSGIQECKNPAEPCHYVVINTCTVTKEADRENRYWIRRARRENANAKIIVTGCYAEKNRHEIEALPGVDAVVANRSKFKISKYLDTSLLNSNSLDEVDKNCSKDAVHRRNYMPFSISRFEGRGRAYLKIQDGCNHACSFCKIILVRGRSLSRPLKGIVEEVLRLRDSGYREIVFAGIQLGAYGLDLGKQHGLAEVLRACSGIEGIERLRLSSIEPTDLNPELIHAFCEISKCCPHLHIPLQSGDDAILQKMNRRYRSAFYIDLVDELKSKLPNFSLTLDVMAGFPGENEMQFQNTINVLERVRPLKAHVFPYSRREGTRASRWTDCPNQVIRNRVKVLLEANDRLGMAVRRESLGKIFPVLVEKKDKLGFFYGLTPNYLKVCFQSISECVGEIVLVELQTLLGDTFQGQPVSLKNERGSDGLC